MLDSLQQAVISDNNKKIKDNPIDKYHFDKLKMYFGEDFEPIKGVVISQPTIGDILEIGEENFYRSISPFLYNSTSIRLQLWDMGIDWNKLKDIEVFTLLIQSSNKDALKLLFKTLRFDDFQLMEMKNDETNEKNLVLCSLSQGILINEDQYMLMAEYIRSMMNSHPKVEKAKGKSTKEWIIQEDRINLQNKLQEKENNTSTLIPLISTCINHPGFKYKLQELKEVGICQFMDSVQRIQKYESAISAMRGMYSGFVDTKKMDKEVFNFMGEI